MPDGELGRWSHCSEDISRSSKTTTFWVFLWITVLYCTFDRRAKIERISPLGCLKMKVRENSAVFVLADHTGVNGGFNILLAKVN